MQTLLEANNRLKSGTRTLEALYHVIMQHQEAPSAQYDKRGEIRYITFSEYDRRVRHAAGALQKLLGASETAAFVGIRLANSPDYFTIFWGAVMAGYQPVLIDYRADEKQTAHIVKQTAAVGVITADAMKLPAGVHLLHPAPLLRDNEQAVRGAFANRLALCTSGTTASSKVYVYDGQALTNAMFDFFAYARQNPGFVSDKPARVLAFLPFHHIFGFASMLLAYTVFGKTLVYPQDLSAKGVQAACRTHHVTHLFNVPLFWNAIAQKVVRAARQKGEEKEKKLQKLIDVTLKSQRVLPRMGRRYTNNLSYAVRKNLLGTHLTCAITGGGRILPETLRTINGIGYPLVNGFGMTELGITSLQALRNIEDQLCGSVGKPMQGVKYKIVPLHGEKPGIGELYVKAASMHIGRMEQSVLTPPVLDEEGYFATGDIARLEGGKLFLEGRVKDVIINESGENVYPDELEDAFSQVENIEQLCAFGMDFGGNYEEITLVVYASEVASNRAKLEELLCLLSRYNAQLPLYKRVRRCYFAASPLPLTGTMKVKRVRVREALMQGRLEAIEVDLAKRCVCSGGAAENSTLERSEEYLAILQTIKRIFAQELSLPEADIAERAHFVYDLGGDSLVSLGVFTRIEEHFGLLITDVEYASCTCAEDAAMLLLQKSKRGGQKVSKRVRTFEESREWQAMHLRFKQAALSGNPYFIAHDSPLRDTSILNGREVINYGSYNYLCLSGHPRTTSAAQEAAALYGASASGSRLLAGEKTLHRQLEQALAAFKHTEDALVLVGGHSTNVTFVGNFCNEHDLILYDALCHNSITQGCELSKAATKGFPHNDFAALESILQVNRDHYEKVLIIIEGVYSMDGDIAPVPAFVRIKQEYDCFLMVDEAHSTCVIGETGRGVDEYFGLAPDAIDIKMGTLSKGFGTCGGYLAGKHTLIEYLRYNVPGFVFSVGLSPILAAATLEGIRLLQEDRSPVSALHKNIRAFISEAHAYGFDTCLAGESAIVPILIGSDDDAFLLSGLLLEENVFVPPAVYPAVPKGQARLRFCLTSAHKQAQAAYALATMDRLVREHGIAVPRTKMQREESAAVTA